MVESSSSTGSVIKTMIGIGTASMIMSLSIQPTYTPKLPTNDKKYIYECTTALKNPCEYLLKNEIMLKVLNQLDTGPAIEIIYSFVNDLVQNSEKSPPHFSKTVDKHFWDLA